MLQPLLGLGLLLIVMACGGSPATPTSTAAVVPTSTVLQPLPATVAGLAGRIAYSSGDNIWVMNADGSGKVQLTDAGPGESDYDPSGSSDGTQIVFRSTRAEPGDVDGLMVVNLDGSGEFKLTQGKVISRGFLLGCLRARRSLLLVGMASLLSRAMVRV